MIYNPLKKSLIKNYSVYLFQCANNAKISLPSIARYLQETAWYHAEDCGAGYHNLKPKGVLWILSSLKIKMQKYPEWGENIQVHTWGKKYQDLIATRDFEILDPAGRIYGLASSAWLLVNSKTHRPHRIQEEFRLIPENAKDTGLSIEKINTRGDFRLWNKRNVLFSDIDIYNHVNNTRYIEWCIDAAYDITDNQTFNVKEITIRFINECLYADIIDILYRKEDGEIIFKGSKNDHDVFHAQISL